MAKEFKFLLSIILITTFFSVNAQTNVEFTKKNFPTRKEAFSEAKKNLKLGDQFYNEAYPKYTVALDYYKLANAFNPNNALLNYKIGICYLNSPTKEKAIRYLKRAETLVYNVAIDINYQLGVAYHASFEFDKAIESFQKYKNNLSPDDYVNKAKMLDKKVKECETAKKLVSDSVRVFIDNLGDMINTPFPEYSPLISVDESMIIFTSKREGSTNNKPNKYNEYDEDIYISVKKGLVWEPSYNAGEPLNTKTNDATVGLSPDGQKLFIYYGLKGGDIMVSEREGNLWGRPKMLPKTINSLGKESSASFSFDGKTIYFSRHEQLPSGDIGDSDIYYSTQDKKGKWTEAKKLSPVINTEYNELDVFMHPDGRTMFFSSNGHTTMGGYDIFKTELKDDGSWTVPENLGYPINTPSDDNFFVLAGNGKHGYYSSGKEGGQGKYDIYKITFLGPEKQLIQSNEDNLIASEINPVKEEPVIANVVEIKTTRLTIVKGIVSDGFATEFTPLEAIIEISDNANGELISSINSNSSSGNFILTLPSGKDYAIAVKKDGYLFHSENFNIPPTSTYQEISLDIKLLKMLKDSKIVLKNVFFEYASAKLDPKSYQELDRLVQILQENPNMKIEIGGHTDNQGSRTTNQKLSEERAKSVVFYLAKVIDISRMEYKGYAFDQPIADNTNDEGRSLNRRVEFKVLSNEVVK
ncbi:MAG: OmpA family protein [Bacteroidales bacterium]|nr:OmpA family protein [Bacteroidales bacterium]